MPYSPRPKSLPVPSASQRLVTIGDLSTHFCEAVAPSILKWSGAARMHSRWLFEDCPPLGRPIASIPACQLRTSHVVTWHRWLADGPMSGYTADKVLSHLSAVCREAELSDIREPDSNPCKPVRRFGYTPRSVFVEEIPHLWRALDLADHARTKWFRRFKDDATIRMACSFSATEAIRLLVLTGARRAEVLQLRWSQVDMQGRALRLPSSKTGRPRMIPLNRLADPQAQGRAQLWPDLEDCTRDLLGRRLPPLVAAMNPRDSRRLIDKALRRANGIVSRGVVKLTTDSGKGQTVGVTVRAGEDHDEVEHFQPFGFTSRVVGTAEALFFAIGGDRAHGIVTAVQDRAKRFRGPSGAGLAPGESALYGADGQRVHCKKDGHVAVVPTGAGYVVLGADDASRFVAIAERVLEELQAVKSYLDGHSHAAGMLLDGTAAPCTGTTGPPTSSAPTPQSVAATKVKAT